MCLVSISSSKVSTALLAYITGVLALVALEIGEEDIPDACFSSLEALGGAMTTGFDWFDDFGVFDASRDLDLCFDEAFASLDPFLGVFDALPFDLEREEDLGFLLEEGVEGVDGDCLEDLFEVP